MRNKSASWNWKVWRDGGSWLLTKCTPEFGGKPLEEAKTELRVLRQRDLDAAHADLEMAKRRVLRAKKLLEEVDLASPEPHALRR